MRRSGKGSGGGLGNSKVTKQSVRTGSAARGVRAGGVAQIGSSMGDHATDHSKPLRGAVEAVHAGPGPAGGAVPLGNEIATNVHGGGPGAGREVYACGCQGQHNGGGK